MADESKKVVHINKFMDGQMTPQEAHRKFAWGGKKCDACGGPAAARIRVFAEYKECLQRSPEFMLKLAANNGGEVPVVDFKTGKFIRVSEAFACANCRATLEKEAAKAPSWCCVEIDTGPKDKVQVGG
jgi:hypothetical protein